MKYLRIDSTGKNMYVNGIRIKKPFWAWVRLKDKEYKRFMQELDLAPSK